VEERKNTKSREICAPLEARLETMFGCVVFLGKNMKKGQKKRSKVNKTVVGNTGRQQHAAISVALIEFGI
jgi:hypothetical protein